MTTKIAWTDQAWNTVSGCTKVGPGCLNCYAEKMTARHVKWGTPKYAAGFNKVVCHESALEEPLKWRKPRRVFVNSMSDTFHGFPGYVPPEFIDRMFAVMALCVQHTFQVLTKRPERMARYMGSSTRTFDIALAVQRMDKGLCPKGLSVATTLAELDTEWPLSNVWLGTSAEDQKRLDERVALLLRTPAAVRFLSLEPLLGPMRLPLLRATADMSAAALQAGATYESTGIAWTIVGGESGPGYREMEIEWLADIVEQCKRAMVPVFVKQDSGPRPGKQGRIPDELWIQEFPK